MARVVEFVIACADSHGDFVFISQVSSAATDAGVTPDHVIGQKFWAYNDPESAAKIQQAFLACILEGETQVIETTSVIGGKRETWRTKFYRTKGPAEVVATAELVKETPKLNRKELELLRLLVADMPFPDIGLELMLTRQALHYRLTRLRAKFGVRTTHGLALAVKASGVLTGPS